jgi:calcineurin-like phosphoesterase
VAFDAMSIDIDEETGKARSIQRIRREETEE